MELWIRSQDKTNLTKVNNLYIPMSRTEEIWCIKQNELYLGYYKTKERALEVLDEIQDILCPPDLVNISGATIVYEMPKE